MMIRVYTTSKTRITVVIEKNIDNSYCAYDVLPNRKNGRSFLFHSFYLDSLIEALQEHFNNEKLIIEV